MIWLWGGDAASADETLIPDFAMVEDNADRPASLRGYTLLEAPYEFGTDNLMDLSHIEFVHEGSFAGEWRDLCAVKHEVIEQGDTIRSNWWMPGVKAPPHTMGVYDSGKA